MGDTQLDATTLIIALSIVIFSVALAQICLLAVAAFLKKSRKKKRDEFSDDDETSGGVN